MATVRNKTTQPVSVTLTDGTGFYFAPTETRSDFPDAELTGPYYQALIAKRELILVPQPNTRKK